MARTAIFVHSFRNVTLVNSKIGLVHCAGATHCLPNFTEVVDVVSNDNALHKETLVKLALIDKLEWNIFTDHISVVDKKENVISQIRTIGFTQMFVKLLVVLYIVSCFDA